MHVVEKAHAKVNLSLLVGPMRPDGYHELFTIFMPIALYDELSFCLRCGPGSAPPGNITLDSPGMDGEDNLVLRALRSLERTAGRAISGEVTLCKGIPVGAGLGGGSADAALALLCGARLLSEEAGVRLSAETLHGLARDLGADVPFFLGRGPAIGRGIGDRLVSIALPSLHLVLLPSTTSLKTPAVYAAFDRVAPPITAASFAVRTAGVESQWRGLAAGKDGRPADPSVTRTVAGLLANDLEVATFSLMPRLAEDRQAIIAAGALGALMSGSGPTLFGVCASEWEAELVCARLQARGYAAYPVDTLCG
ncbi:MAG: 4-(cytidine 5'-diphospho)-2-C-methyl-D-erythritol kinase [Thermoleophilia bacterium]